MTIADDARIALKGLLGGDRIISRAEIQKLTLYAHDKGTITLDDVRALIGDTGASATDDTIDAVAEGDAASTAATDA